jgi:hypothetical protein
MTSSASLADKILLECDGLEPDEGAVFKFERPGQAIVARFVARRKNIRTKSATGLATCLDVEILQSTGSDIVGPATVFESSHITQIMDRANLSAGQAFVLKFHNVDRRTRFKRFAFKRVPELDAAEARPAQLELPFDEDHDGV